VEVVTGQVQYAKIQRVRVCS